MGLGHALFEEMIYEGSQLKSRAASLRQDTGTAFRKEVDHGARSLVGGKASFSFHKRGGMTPCSMLPRGKSREGSR